MTAGAERLLYRLAGVPIVRATTRPDGAPLAEGLSLSGSPEAVVAEGLAWLTQAWQHEEARRAVETASPALAQQISGLLEGRSVPVRQVRRLVVSLASYQLRWQGRATPFGLFAGVSTAEVGTGAHVRWGESHRTVARADAQWLGAVIAPLEQHPRLLERLTVITNPVAFVRGDRLVVPGEPPDDSPGVLAPIEISVGHTRPVRTATEAAREPIRFQELLTLLAAEYPSAPPEQIRSLLAGLVAQHLLLTNLRASMTVPDALGHLRAQLEAADADELPDLTSLVHDLRLIHDDLSCHNDTVASPTAAYAMRAAVAERMNAICDIAPQPLVVDTALDCDVSLPEAVIHEAETAASALLRLTPYPFGYPRWKDFHVRFRQRYGVGAVVPVVELIGDTGLGLPAGYLGSPVANTARTLTERDETLLALVQQAVIDGAEEIVLTEPLVRQLAVGDPSEMLPPARAELTFQIHATSPQAVEKGAFRLLVSSAPRPGSSMAGRFADLLPEADRKILADTYAALSTDAPGAIAAQLSFFPRRRRSENVVRTPQLLPHTISLAEHRDPHPDLIPLHDLAVTADARQFHLVQLSTGRRVEPRVVHALEAGTLTPPLARFLAEITTARCAVYKPFDWGTAVRLPYLPRLRYGRSVLSPARWLLTAADLPKRAATPAEWDKALATWRRRLRAPEAVVACESDLRLPLDLSQPLHRALLRNRLDAAREVELQEAPTPADLAWMGRAHEFFLTLRLAQPRAAERNTVMSSPLPAVKRDAGHLPGRSEWLYAQVHGHPDRQDEVLTEHLPRLLDGWTGLRQWWFRRHRDTTRPDSEQYLDLHLRLPTPGEYGQAAARVGEWAADLRGCGLLAHLQLATYCPEAGRYGHSEAMDAAHEVFAADSAAALAQITLAIHTGLPPKAVTAAGLVDLAASYAESPDIGMRWLIDRLPHEQGKLDQKLRDTGMRLADPADDWATLRATPGAETVTRAWERRRTALTTYRTHLARQRDPYSVLRSLLHMHHVRTIGVDPDRERVTHRLARASALRQSAREHWRTP
ncbi:MULTISPECIES: lantibiotic dehydratase [Streptomyces]|uniref:Lantibiotic dehydratase n=3 Tax=Streptomyces TaxID=1883 RepID=A0A927L0D3_9ACTN|nr:MULTISPECIES: lantibiotic dehydratase [Streptomyces]MBD9702119.1 lantibiotic dehydratase [Streptomyces caniscabiei]MBD9722718.1 lantibiotic dehydratase [Streptomyces caniscabiei]MBE4738787.1 lantibiotic dehydratase [Streptomyces caniscabiei]MBE4758073.1 lantibiotic dehydratase [Streptomyces caniscabiei]MBE4787734.1 lantibiotic dehydratase [Streptomyces caniscabiei]